MKVDFILRLRTSYVTSNRSTYQKIVSSNTHGPFGFRLLHTSHSLLEKEGWGQYGFNPCTEFKGLPGWIDVMDIELANMGDPKEIAAIGDGKVFAQSAAQWKMCLRDSYNTMQEGDMDAYSKGHVTRTGLPSYAKHRNTPSSAALAREINPLGEYLRYSSIMEGWMTASELVNFNNRVWANRCV